MKDKRTKYSCTLTDGNLVLHDTERIDVVTVYIGRDFGPTIVPPHPDFTKDDIALSTRLLFIFPQ